jgi:hypothetical protein
MSRRFQGANEVNIPIEDILREYAAWTDEIVKAVGDELLKETRAKARTAFADRSGKLRKSIRRKKSKFDKEMHIVGAFMPHAHLIEFGHDVKVSKGGRVVGHAKAHPFLREAEKAVRDRLPEIVRKVVGG